MLTTKSKIGISVGVGVIVLVGIVMMTGWLGDSRKRAQAKGERLIKRDIATPIVITNVAASGGLPEAVPSGFQVFNNVPLQINGMMYLWGEGGASKGMNFPKEIRDIPVERRFKTLYVYHGSYYGSPPGTPVFEVVLNYLDGTSVTNRLLYGDDVLDWFAPGGDRVRGPTGPNSKLAWIGKMPGRNGGVQQLRFCMTAIENPQPDSDVTTLDLRSCGHRTVAYVMAMTTGEPGLMNDSTPVDERKE